MLNKKVVSQLKQIAMEYADVEPPRFIPLHEKFVGRCKVLQRDAFKTRNLGGPSVSVDLTLGTCTCPHGVPYTYDNGKWRLNRYCIHKLRAIADIVVKERAKGNDLTWPYVKALSTRYNRFEVVSAFHKELRRGDIKAALFWGSILSAFRGVDGIYKYISTIVYEETREHNLAMEIVRQVRDQKTSFAGACKLIMWFCLAPKKWELKHRFPIWENEVRAAAELIKKYGRVVAKSETIDTSQIDMLKSFMIKGLGVGGALSLQIGVKGLLRCKLLPEWKTQDNLRAEIANWLIDKVEGLPKPNKYKREGYNAWIEYLTTKAQAGLGIGYDDINAFADFLAGEERKMGVLLPQAIKELQATSIPDFAFGFTPNIPKYAHDNHTYLGKNYLRHYPEEWQSGAEQIKLDLRWCGAYMGVAWRYLAMMQFPGKDLKEIPWQDVTFPKAMHGTAADLWY